MLERLELALTRERNFVSDASHELRTPLAILKTELELAAREGRSLQDLQSAVRSAAEETERLVRLAEDLLVIARSDQGRLPVRYTRIDVADFLAGVGQKFQQRAGESGRRIGVEMEAGRDLTLFADSLRLEQALGNLVDNALRYGGGAVRITARQRDARIEIHVADDGPGLPPYFLERAFERFSRADESRGRGGTGLGLAVVEAIARAHGGSAHAANRAGGGADIWLSLPTRPPAPDREGSSLKDLATSRFE
jgi:signal transduction histidine kinase